jgi:hypothetical protein
MKTFPLIRPKRYFRESERRVLTLLVPAALLLGTSSCATPPFVPYTGENAGKLRMRLLTTGLFVRVVPILQQVTAGQCGTRTVVPTLVPVLPSAVIATHPRVEMDESTDASNTDAAEVRLPAGRYLVTLFGVLGMSQCSTSGMLEVAADQQYDVDFSIGVRGCESSLRRLHKPTGANGPPRWTPEVWEPAQACSKA